MIFEDNKWITMMMLMKGIQKSIGFCEKVDALKESDFLDSNTFTIHTKYSISYHLVEMPLSNTLILLTIVLLFLRALGRTMGSQTLSI